VIPKKTQLVSRDRRLYCAVTAGLVGAALVVPTEIPAARTQPNEVSGLETPTSATQLPRGLQPAVEPSFNWRGSMMANARATRSSGPRWPWPSRTVDGAGDLCIRCHSTAGWLGGRSTPTDGSALTAGDADGVECDACHKMTKPEQPRAAGRDAWRLRGQCGQHRERARGRLLRQRDDVDLARFRETRALQRPAARHQFCSRGSTVTWTSAGSCHDVSNAAVGDLAHNNGAPIPLQAGTFSGVLGSPVAGKAAFNNLPYKYGVVERTFSEFRSGALPVPSSVPTRICPPT